MGLREPDIYGKQDYNALVSMIKGCESVYNITTEIYQSNHEGDIVDKIQSAYGNFDGIVINPAAYTHTSIAILDALKAVGVPTVEVHISDISKREDFRQISFVSLAAVKTICGHGFDGYIEAIEFLSKNY